LGLIRSQTLASTKPINSAASEKPKRVGIFYGLITPTNELSVTDEHQPVENFNNALSLVSEEKRGSPNDLRLSAV
jgi:hypothetical protein